MIRAEPIDPATWPGIYALLEPAIEQSDTTARGLIDDLLAGDAQLWTWRDPELRGACITELIDGPRGRSLHCSLLAGHDFEEWADQLIEGILIQARPLGVQSVTVEGRLGWERALGKRGWKRKAVIMELRLGVHHQEDQEQYAGDAMGSGTALHH